MGKHFKNILLLISLVWITEEVILQQTLHSDSTISEMELPLEEKSESKIEVQFDLEANTSIEESIEILGLQMYKIESDLYKSPLLFIPSLPPEQV